MSRWLGFGAVVIGALVAHYFARRRSAASNEPDPSWSDEPASSASESELASDASESESASSASESSTSLIVGEPVRGLEDMPAEIVAEVLDLLLVNDIHCFYALCCTSRFICNVARGLRATIIARIEAYSGLKWQRWLDAGIGPKFQELYPRSLWQTWHMIKRLSRAVASFRDNRLHRIHVKATDRGGRPVSFIIQARQSPNRCCTDVRYPMMCEWPVYRSSVKLIVTDICMPTAGGSHSLCSIRSLRFENFCEQSLGGYVQYALNNLYGLFV
eukprot:TRINITY_DN14158_c0_g1_i1.p1 TRINITY_DN14158_c0_g1~~TRINITY_DN14158_c0_g1_i1.p1  ORF type:complete len:273 (-),score=25.19 TRINITY_DN14158_c0_g1_i1:49-867(-)